MASFSKFNAFVEALALKKLNLSTDTIKVMLSNTAMSATNSIKSDLTEISAGNGYTSGGNTATVTSAAQTSGTFKLVLADPAAFVASGGSIGPFRYVAIYSDTATNKDLIGYYDYGTSITLADGESFQVDFDPTNGVLTIA
jgi:hypothetical protein